MAHYKANAGKWHKGQVPYRISSAAWRFLDPLALRDTIAHFRDNTPIRLVRRTNQRDYVHIVVSAGTSTCRSYVGKKKGRQLIKIPLSGYRNTADCLIHEFGHVLGLVHEHQRKDRDFYVNVNLSKAKKACRLGDYKKLSPPFYLPYGPYDRKSLMHYSKNSTVRPRGNVTLGGRRLSADDKALLTMLYK